MAKIKFTKGELKRERDRLAQFEHYLPILQLKKQQLQIEIGRVREASNLKAQEIDSMEGEISEWVPLLNEPGDFISGRARPKNISVGKINIAGVDLPSFEGIEFEEIEYDLFLTPLWVDTAVEKIKGLVRLLEEKKILNEQLRILRHELVITAQRVNLFEKIKIPGAKENIRLIRIYLGDQETNAVGRSKMAKRKIERLVLEGIAV